MPIYDVHAEVHSKPALGVRAFGIGVTIADFQPGAIAGFTIIP